MVGLGDIGGVAGLGLEIYGGIMGSEAARKKADAQKQIALLEKEANQQKRQSMELDVRRRNMEDVRQAQRMRYANLSAQSISGAQYGSIKGGAEGSIQGGVGNNILNLSQSRQIGEKLFDIDDSISNQKMEVAAEEGKMAEYSAISGFGKGLVGDSSILNKFWSSGSGSG